jgi:p-aminobenzoyl-glutamate transporter AbgT
MIGSILTTLLALMIPVLCLFLVAFLLFFIIWRAMRPKHKHAA